MDFQNRRLSSKYTTLEQAEKIFKFIMDDDLDFYEEYVIHLTDEQQEKFFDKNPEFMSEFPVNRDEMNLLKDKMFRDILRRIKRSVDR